MDAGKLQRSNELVCFECQKDIQNGRTLEECARQHNSDVTRHTPHHGVFDPVLRPDNSRVDEGILRAARYDHQEMPALTYREPKPASFGSARTLSDQPRTKPVEFQRRLLGGNLRAEYLPIDFQSKNATREALVKDLQTSPSDSRQHGITPHVPQSRSAAAVPRSHDLSDGMRVSDLLPADAAALPSHRNAPSVDGSHTRGTSKFHGLPRAALCGGGQLSASREKNPPQDSFSTALAVLDGMKEECWTPVVGSDVAHHLQIEPFLQWVEVSLGLPSEAAVPAAAAAFRKTEDACRKLVTHDVRASGVPRSMFSLLLFNLKMEFHKQDMRARASDVVSPKLSTKKLPSRLKGISPLSPLPSHGQQHLSREIEKQPSHHDYSDPQIGSIAEEICLMLQRSGFNSEEECQKVASDLASSGVRDTQTLVQLLRQDTETLAQAGLQPSHVLKVLRHMAKESAFAAEKTSFRLTLSEI
jgi:hypothetical protein